MRFGKLTKSQTDAMNYVAFNGFCGGRPPFGKTAQSLVDRGFLQPEKKPLRDKFGAFEITGYAMPIAVHAAWCSHVSKDVGDDEL